MASDKTEMRKKKDIPQSLDEYSTFYGMTLDVADYEITYRDGSKQVIDTKGFADSVALMKRKMFWFKYPDVDYRWITYSKIDGGWVDYDDLKKARKERKKLKQAQTKGR